MSVNATKFAWELVLEPATKFVFLAIADHAGIDGENAHPSIERLATLTGYSERQVQRALKFLRDVGLVLPDTTKGGRGRVATYRIPLELADERWPKHGPKGRRTVTLFDEPKGDTPSPIPDQKGRQGVTHSESEKGDTPSPISGKRVTPVAQKGDIHDGTIKGVKNRHEPSMVNAPQPPVRLLPRPSGAPPIGETAAEAEQRNAVYGAYCRGVGIKPDTAEFITRWHQAWQHLSSAVLEVLTPERMHEIASFVSMRRKADGIKHPPTVELVLMAESEFDAWDDAGRPDVWNTTTSRGGSRTPASGLDMSTLREFASGRSGRS